MLNKKFIEGFELIKYYYWNFIYQQQSSIYDSAEDNYQLRLLQFIIGNSDGVKKF